MEAGLNKNYYQYAKIGVSLGLDQGLSDGLERDCEIMVAAQTIMLAGGGTLANKWFFGFLVRTKGSAGQIS